MSHIEVDDGRVGQIASSLSSAAGHVLDHAAITAGSTGDGPVDGALCAVVRVASEQLHAIGTALQHHAGAARAAMATYQRAEEALAEQSRAAGGRTAR